MCYFTGESHWDQTASEINYDSVTVKGLEFGSLYEMRVVAVDGRFETPSEIEEIETGGLGMCIYIAPSLLFFNYGFIILHTFTAPYFHKSLIWTFFLNVFFPEFLKYSLLD